MSGENIEYEARRTELDGSEKWYDLRWINITNEEQQNWGFILSIKDITKAKIAEIERERMTLELVNRNRDLEQFTYVVSHNLPAPVANIMGLAALIGDAVRDDHSADQLINNLSVSVKKLDGVINDLNQVLQVKELVNQKKEKVNFQQLMEDIEMSISHLIAAENVTIHSDFKKIPCIATVKGYFYSIFYNLIVNSIHYRRKDVDPVISIRSFIDKKSIRLEFEDNCKGINLPKDGANLFGLYKRIDTSVEGKGMGLFMVKTQLESLKGHIEVESELGKGTRFTITLPI